jgi:hypothetical protein
MTRPGAVAEWLGRGLQSLVQRFESARRLRSSLAETSDARPSGSHRRGRRTPGSLPLHVVRVWNTMRQQACDV